MTQDPKNYFVYLPSTPERSRWGVEILGAGFTDFPPKKGYPPEGHPSDHSFDFKKGRTLRSFQILCITSGQGTLETASCSRQKITAGTVFLLFPGEWHTYRPDPKTGWVEHWIELDGSIPRQLINDGLWQKNRCVFAGGAATGIASAFQNIHLILQGKKGARVSEMSAAAYGLLALCADLPALDASRADVLRKVRLAEQQLSAPDARQTDLETLAKELGWGYSYFRRVFKEQTGLSPWQYCLNSRLDYARRLLSSSSHTLDRIAEMAGFSSGFHLSNAFKKSFGISPGQWRKDEGR